jgi:hypothetical protein
MVDLIVQISKTQVVGGTVVSICRMIVEFATLRWRCQSGLWFSPEFRRSDLYTALGTVDVYTSTFANAVRAWRS